MRVGGISFSLPVQLMNAAVKHSQCLIICILWFLFCIYVFTSCNSQATERVFFKVSRCHGGIKDDSQPWFPPHVLQ